MKCSHYCPEQSAMIELTLPSILLGLVANSRRLYRVERYAQNARCAFFYADSKLWNQT